MPRKTIAYKWILFILIFFQFAVYGQEKIYFEPKAASGGTLSTFIECMDAIPLETTSESRFDRFSQLTPTKNYFVVLDYSSKNILVFDKQGKFLKKISIKQDINQLKYNEVDDRLELVTLNKQFKLTAKDNAQIIEHYDDPKNIKYFRKYFIDLTSLNHFALQKDKPTSLTILDPLMLENNLSVINKVTVDKNFKSDTGYELKVFKNNQLIHQYFPYNKKNDPRYIFDFTYIFISPAIEKETWWVTHPFDYTIYKLTPDSLYKVYDIIFPLDRSVPQDFYAKQFSDKTEKDNFKRQNKKAIRQVFMKDLSPTYQSLSFSTMWYENQYYLYDNKVKTIYDVEKIKLDSLTWNMPILKNQLSSSSNKGVYISKIQAEDAINAYTDNKNSAALIPKKLHDFFETAKPDDNPILIFYRYKN